MASPSRLAGLRPSVQPRQHQGFSLGVSNFACDEITFRTGMRPSQVSRGIVTPAGLAEWVTGRKKSLPRRRCRLPCGALPVPVIRDSGDSVHSSVPDLALGRVADLRRDHQAEAQSLGRVEFGHFPVQTRAFGLCSSIKQVDVWFLSTHKTSPSGD